MARSLWKGAISFGLVNMPVELYPAENRKSFRFSMLDKRDFSPVGYKRYSKVSGKEVDWSNVVKGYEYAKDRYVVLSDEDFRRANAKATQTIEIRSFVACGEIPVQYFETPYYLAPAIRGAKVYALLRETLRSTGRAAVAEVVIRTVPHLAAVVVEDHALMLVTLRYPDELRAASGLELPPAGLKKSGVSAKEVALAKRLVEDMTEPWTPSEYRDTYHDDLMARIKQKVKGGQTHEITKPGAEEEAPKRSAKIVDLAALLRQSLGDGGAAPRKGRRRAAGATPRGKPNLRVVSRTPAARQEHKTAKAAAHRKRA